MKNFLLLKVIFLTTTLPFGLICASSKDLGLNALIAKQVFSSFERNIRRIDRLLKLETSFLNPGSDFNDKQIAELTQKWVEKYMTRFYSKNTNFMQVDFLVERAATKNPQMKSKYEEIQIINWNNKNITYVQLRKNLSELVLFYQTYSDAIKNELLLIVPETVANISPSAPINPQKPINANKRPSYLTTLIKWKNKFTSFINSVIVSIKSLTNRFF